MMPDQATNMNDEVDEARLYLQIGDVEVSLSGSIREVNDRWQSIKDEDDWKSSITLVSRQVKTRACCMTNSHRRREPILQG